MTNDLPITRTLERLGQSIEQRESAKVYQLPLWGDPQRGVPNDFARSALFSATKGTGTTYLREEVIFSQAGVSITYSGPRLTQDHLDVFEAIMHLAREMPEGNAVRFTRRGILKLIGRGIGNTDHQRLMRTLTDLTATSVTVKRKGAKVYWGSLLPEGAANPENGFYAVLINRNLIKLFERGFTIIEWEQRRALARKPLAQALQVWLSSHDNPYPVTVQYLHDITGSKDNELRYFRRRLLNALNQLKEVGILAGWRYDKPTGKVHFVKA